MSFIPNRLTDNQSEPSKLGRHFILSQPTDQTYKEVVYA